MPYLIKSKTTKLRLRDGVKLTDPVYDVGLKDFVPFNNLPRGCDPHADRDLEIRVVDSLEGYAQPKARNAAPVEAAPVEAAPVEAPSGHGALFATLAPEKQDQVLQQVAEAKAAQAEPVAKKRHKFGR